MATEVFITYKEGREGCYNVIIVLGFGRRCKQYAGNH